MAWTTPTNINVNDVFTATRWNTQVKDNLLMLSTLANTGGIQWDDTNKRLGLGTTSPSEMLHIQSIADGVAMLETTNASNFAYFRLKTPSRRYQFAAAGASAFNGNNFYIYEEVAAATRFVLTSTGSVLIGKTSGLTGAGDLDINGAGQIGTNLGVGNAITTGGAIAAGAAITAGTTLAANTLPLVVAGYRVPPLVGRKGGSATNWNTTGTTGYSAPDGMFQSGSTSITVGAGTGGTISPTFHVGYTDIPQVWPSLECTSTTSTVAFTLQITAKSASGFTVFVANPTGGSLTFTINWLALGPR